MKPWFKKRFFRNSTPTRVKMGEKVLVFSDFCYGYFVLFLMSNNDQVKLVSCLFLILQVLKN